MTIRTLLIILCCLQVYNLSAQKEHVQLDMDLRDGSADSTKEEDLKGIYSLSMCDADLVAPDTVNANAVAELLLCSELRGRIEQPNYYFSDSPNAKRDLDLLMMTQGWRRYPLADMLEGHLPTINHPIEQHQTISGSVRSTLNRRPRHLQIVMFNPQTFVMQTFSLGDSSRFVIRGIDYKEGDVFTLEVTRQGEPSQNLRLMLDSIDLPRLHALASSRYQPAPMKEFATQAEKQRMYMDAFKMIELPDVKVKGKRKTTWRNRRGFASRGFAADDPRLSRFSDIKSMLRFMGINVRMDNAGKFYFGKGSDGSEEGFILTPTYIDGASSEQEEIWDLQITDVEQVEYLAPNDPANIIYGGNAVKAGCLLVYLKDGGKPKARVDSPAVRKVRQLGYRPPVEFYSPQYPAEDKSVYTVPDYRTTLYWNPKVIADENGRVHIDFYGSDVSHRYLVILEGVSDKGTVVNRQIVTK